MIVPGILSVVAPGNGSGKTRLVATIVAAYPGVLTAVKFTTVYRDGENCPRTETACACRALHGRFTIISDPSVIGQESTDTGRFVGAGAKRTLWCLSIPTAHAEAWEHLRTTILDDGDRLVTEGNRIVPVLSPDALVMVINPAVPRDRWKDDTWELAGRADLVVMNRYDSSVTPGLAELEREIRGRVAAPVIEQDVAAPLASWTDMSLRLLAERVYRAPAVPSLEGASTGAIESHPSPGAAGRA